MAGLVIAPLSLAQNAAPTVDEVVAKHLAARGGVERLKAIQTVRMTGLMDVVPGLTAPFVLEMKRQSKMRLDMTVQGVTGSQAFDGSSGWVLMPFTGMSKPDVMTADAVQEAKAQADFDGPLVDYKAKGNR